MLCILRRIIRTRDLFRATATMKGFLGGVAWRGVGGGNIGAEALNRVRNRSETEFIDLV